jgi:uncharacterized protein YbcI
VSEQPQRSPAGVISAAISNGAVKVLNEYTGRGPTRARTTIGPDVVVILLGDTLTKAERSLAKNGDAHWVLDMRRRFQEAMRQDLVGIVETETGRKVIAFMSDNHIEPDLGVELFVLEPLPSDEPEAPVS